MTTKQVCEYLGISRPTLHRRIVGGDIIPLPTNPVYKKSVANHFRRADVERLKAGHGGGDLGGRAVQPVSIEHSGFPNLRDRLQILSELEDNWDSSGRPAPNLFAISRAQIALDILSARDFVPSGLVRSGEDGVAIFFDAPGRYGDIDFMNSGEILAVTDLRGQNPRTVWPTVWEVADNEESIGAALGRIYNFIHGTD